MTNRRYTRRIKLPGVTIFSTGHYARESYLRARRPTFISVATGINFALVREDCKRKFARWYYEAYLLYDTAESSYIGSLFKSNV